MEQIKNIIRTAKNKSKGVTIVALIVTVIILIILAGITITALNGDKRIDDKS